ncbi:uncharacterized protein BXZ73DRAFT_80425 [Epithele typhae]|uniref:uncharacterized protein n=1 Tax=Epithele typhae TaxID=378194 RepID=UPI002008D963|nr:uncharacterized protein BXZ73DRAFT_80425 [Epithele typhae]KAH9919216.1 hypothetical protein BXZ73DRAFT_80425 [Epithele typhae]
MFAEAVQDTGSFEHADVHNRSEVGLAGAGVRALEDAPEVLAVHASGQGLSDVPPTLESDGSLTQADLTALVVQRVVRDHMLDAEDEFKLLQHTPIALSKLKDYCENDKVSEALEVMQEKHWIQPDPTMYIAANDASVVVDVVETRWDAEIRIPCATGFGVVLPHPDHANAATFREWRVNMRVKDTSYPFKGSRDSFPFDPTGRLVYFGKTGGNADIYIGWIPNAILDENHKWPEHGKNPTSPSKKLALATQAMITHFLHKSKYRTINCSTTYPPLDHAKFKAASNLLTVSANTLSMTQEELASFSRSMRDGYQAWYNNAPKEYKEIPQMVNSFPGAIYIEFGQDYPLEVNLGAHPERQWLQHYNVDEFYSMGFAVTSHLRAGLIEERTPIPTENLEGRQLYTTPDPRTREPIDDIADYPLLDEYDDNREIRVYNEQGYRVNRHHFQVREIAPALLANVKASKKLFEAPARTVFEMEDDQDLINDTPINYKATYNAYPLGFMHSWGHWQSDGFTLGLHKKVDELTKKVSAGDAPAIVPAYSQGYNTAIHRARASAETHMAQRGLMTTVSSGAWATSPKAKQSAQDLLDLVTTRSPGEWLDSQLESDEETLWRQENNYVIVFFRLKGTINDGAKLFLRIIRPLAKLVTHPTVFDPMVDCLIAIKDNNWPALLKWTTFPTRCWIKAVYETHIHKHLVSQPQTLPHPVWVEVIAILDRLFNYAYTGAARVLCGGAMKALFATPAVTMLGFPMLREDIVWIVRGKPRIDAKQWPVDHQFKRPHTVSEKAIQYAYGAETAASYMIHFRLLLSTEHTHWLSNDIPGVADFPRVAFIAELIYEALVSDYVEFVNTEVSKDINKILKDPSHRDHNSVKDRR